MTEWNQEFEDSVEQKFVNGKTISNYEMETAISEIHRLKKLVGELVEDTERLANVAGHYDGCPAWDCEDDECTCETRPTLDKHYALLSREKVVLYGR
jgi:hypothetical protein